MAAMRILHLVARSHRRGAELAALELAHELDALGYENRMLALGRAFDGSAETELPYLTANVGMGPLDLIRGVRQLRRNLAGQPVDVVLAHGGWPVQVAAFGRRANAPLLVWQRIQGFPPAVWRSPRRQWWRAVAGRTDAVVALTADIHDELRHLGFDRPVWIIPNFRRPDRFAAVDRDMAAKRLRVELGLEPDVLLLGLVGHLIAVKRPERALEVLAGVRARGLPAKLVVAGTGPLQGAFEAEARNRGLGAHVHVLGHRDDVEQVLGALDVLLLTSDDEGIPGVVIEAQMTAVPVVTFALGGVATVVEDGVTGVVIDGIDCDVMAEHAAGLLHDNDRRERMGDEARRRAQRFSTERAAREYAERLGTLYEAARTRGQ